MRCVTAHASLITLALLLGACGSGPGGSDPPAPPPAADTTAPTAPGGVTAAALSATRIQLSWTAASDAGTGVAGYRIYRDGAGTALATVTSTNYTDASLAAETTYGYAVTAFDGATPPNESARSAVASATTLAAPSGTGGLDGRPANSTCVAGDAPSNAVSLAVQRVFANLGNFDQPIAMLQEPASNARWYVAQKSGAVRVFDNNPNVSTSREFINVASRLNSAPNSPNDERGLLGMAFHPDWPTNPRVYLFYTGTHATLGLVDRVSEFRSTDGGNTLALNTELEILNVDDPENNHNGGNLAFGPDGMLYVGIGDGGGGGDGHGDIGNGQRLTTLLGKLLRIDVSAASQATPYAIPAGNPFAANARCTGGTGAASCPEIYAYGFRNPWRWSFDRGGTHELWLNDVGQSALEEIDKVTLGGNYGWRCFEGTNPFNADCGSNPEPIPPVAQYGRSQGFSTTGGFVYRGSAIPALSGRYVFGDYGGALWSIARDTTPTLTLGNGLSTGLQIVSFGQDQAGELYIVSLGASSNAGTLHRIVPGTASGRQIASQLSASGCVAAGDATQPATGLIPYAPNAAFFSDGAVKDRWLALPDGQSITVGADGDFEFPTGSVLVKNFRLGSTPVETRLFMRHNDGNWAGYTYEWNAGGTDATRVIGGKTVQVAGQSWEFPSEAQCLQCHTAAAGRVLGLEVGQLNGDLGYPTGRTANQLTTLNLIDVLTPALTQAPDQLPVIPDPQGGGAIEPRARAWLHTNCANCHRPGGGTQSTMDLRFTTRLADTGACDVAPALGNLGIGNARLIAPGSAARSVVVARVNRLGAEAMPPLARHLIDAAGVQLLSGWIDGLSGCTP